MRGRPGALTKAAPQMPPRASCLGIEFLEFAADDAPAAELAKLFCGLGFRKSASTSRKRSRIGRRGDQSRPQPRQGRLRPLPSAHAWPSVCAHLPEGRRRGSHARPRGEAARHPVPPGGRPGRVGNSGGARARRKPALFRRSESELGKLWDIDFEPAAATAAAGGDAGLTSIDHISQSMDYEEMLSWLLFYTSLLDVEQDAAARRHRSGRHSAQPGGAEPTAALAHRAQRLAEPADVVVTLHHALFRLRRAARRLATATPWRPSSMRANGVTLLPMPENYYDDLEARTDLPPTASTCCPQRPSSMIATRPENISRPTPQTSSRLVLLRNRRAPGLQRLRRGERINSPGRPDAGIRSGALGYFSPDSSFTTRAFCAGVTSLTTPTTFLWVLAGSRYSMIRSILSPSAMSCGLCSVSFIAACR